MQESFVFPYTECERIVEPNNMSLFNCVCVIHVEVWSESVERIYITTTFMQLPADA